MRPDSLMIHCLVAAIDIEIPWIGVSGGNELVPSIKPRFVIEDVAIGTGVENSTGRREVGI